MQPALVCRMTAVVDPSANHPDSAALLGPGPARQKLTFPLALEVVPVIITVALGQQIGILLVHANMEIPVIGLMPRLEWENR